MQNHLRLDDLLARDVTPQWFEGVAVVQLICRQSRARGANASGFPRAADILIGPGGSIAVAGESVGNPVQAAGHVLALMLSDDAPVRLRLAMSQATATGGYTTLTEFSEALGYFERPNPEAIVEAFCQRARAAAPRQIAPPVRIDTPSVSEKQTKPVSTAAASRVSRLAVIAATFLALACTSIWVIGHGLTDVLKPKAVMVETGENRTPEVHPSAKNKTVAATARPRENISITAATPQPVEPRGTTMRSALASAPELQVFATTLSYAYPESLPPAAIRNFPATTQVGLVTSDDVVVDRTEKTSDRIYSQTDPQVTLPVSVYPKLPSEAAGVPVAGRTILELTIAPDGLVERVRMLTAPRNIHEFMLLSAAKAWRFEPARIDGRPVRFRQTMTLTSLP